WGRHGLALSLYALGRWEEADKAWTQLEARSVPPAIARDVLFWHGDTLGRLGQVARAETMLRQFTQGGAHPLFPPGVLRVGWWALAAGHAQEAVAAFRAYSGSAETEWSAAGLALSLVATGDWAGARKSVAALGARRSPLAYPMLFRLARAAAEMSPPGLAAAGAALAGEAAYQAGDFMAAGAALRRMLVEFPTDAQAPLARTALAWTYLKQGRKSDARRELLEAVRAKPDDPRAPDTLLLASELALEADDLTAGREMVDRIVASYPTHPRADFARFNRGLAMLRQGDAAGAEAALRGWLGRAPFPALFGRAHAALGTALLSQGRRDEALREFTLAQKDGSVALGQLGVASLALAGGRRDEAERLFTAVRNAGTPDEVAAATYGLAVVAFAKGGTRDFKAPAQAALSATPSGPAGASRAAPLLYALAAIAVDDKDWPGAFGLARRL